MKVLFVILGAYSKTGGIEKFNRSIIECLWSDLTNINNVVIISLWDSAKDGPKSSSGRTFLGANRSKIVFLREFLRAMIIFRPRIIIYGHLFLSPLAILGKILLPHSKQHVIAYGFEAWGKEFTPPGYRSPTLLEIWAAIKACDSVVSISEFTRNRMKKAYNLPHEKSFILPCTIGLQRKEIKELPEKRTRGCRLLTVSRLDTYKGVDKVIQALPAIIQDFPEVEYWVVGDGPSKREWQMLAAELGVDDRVHFWGKVDEQMLIRAYSEADIFVLPSTAEGFGIVFLEAWQYGLPVIGGNIDASAEVIDSCGIAVDPTDIRAIANAIKDLCRDKEKSQMLGRLGYERLLRNYTLDAFCNNLSNFLCSSIVDE